MNNTGKQHASEIKYFDYPSKYYCTDIGLRNVRLGLRQLEKTGNNMI